MKKKQLLALALVGAMSVGTAAQMAPVHAEMKEAPASKEQKEQVASRIREIKSKSDSATGKILGTDRIKNALAFLVENGREENYDLLKEVNSLYTTKLGDFINFRDDAHHDSNRTEESTTSLADQSILEFIENEDALQATIDGKNLVNRYTEDGVNYDNVAQYLEAANKNVEAFKQAVKVAQNELEIAKQALASIPEAKAGEAATLTEQRQEAESNKTAAELKVTQANKDLLDKEIEIVNKINLTELRHRVQKAVTSLVEKMKAKVDEREKKAALESAKNDLTMATKVESLGIGETAWQAGKTKAINDDATMRANFLATVNEQIVSNDPIKITEDDVKGFLTGNMSHVVALNNETKKTTIQRKLDLMQTVVDTTSFDKEKMAEAYNLAMKAQVTSNYAGAKTAVTTAKTAVDNAEKVYNTAVEVSKRAVELYKRELANIKLANFAQHAMNLSYMRDVKMSNLESVKAQSEMLLSEKQAADGAVKDQENLIAKTDTTSEAGKAQVEAYKSRLEALKETAKEATTKYDNHMKDVEKLSKEYTELSNGIIAAQEKLLAGTNYQDMLDVTRVLTGFKEAHNKLATRLEMPTFDVAEHRAVAKEPVNWVNVDGTWYYRSKKGTNKYVSEWAKIDNVWYRFDENGAMLANKWFKDTNNRWYWLNASGRMAEKEWVNVDGSWFFAYGNGAIAENEWVLVNGTWYYAQNGGYIAIDKTLNINGVDYSFDATGALK